MNDFAGAVAPGVAVAWDDSLWDLRSYSKIIGALVSSTMMMVKGQIVIPLFDAGKRKIFHGFVEGVFFWDSFWCGTLIRYFDEGSHSCRWLGNAHIGGIRLEAQADDRDRRAPNPLAYHEDVLGSWHP